MLFARNRIALALMMAVPVMAVTASQSAYAQTFSTVYVRDVIGQNGGGAGTQASPFDSFESALHYARQNPNTIKLLGNVVVSRHTEANGRIQPLNLGGVTIDGDGNTLTVRGAPLSLTGDTVIKNIHLDLPSLNNAINLDVAAEAAREKDQYIYLNGNRLELDNVRTQTGSNPLSRPTFVLGNGVDTAGDAGNAELVLKNTTVKHIVAGNLNGQTKTTDAKISIDSGSEVIGDIHFGVTGNAVTGKVSVVSQTQKVGGYIGGTSINNTLEIKGVSAFRETLIDGVQNLTLTDKSDLMVNKLNITGTLTLSDGTRINAEPTADNAIVVGNIDAQGKNEIRFTNENTVTGGISGDANLKIKGETELNKVYVSVGNNTGTVNLTAPDNRTAIAFANENGRYKAVPETTQSRWQGAPVIGLTADQNRDGKLTPDERPTPTATASVSLPQGTKTGDWVFVTVKTTKNGVEHETTEDIEVTDEMLRAGTATFTVQTADAEKIAIDAYLDNGSGEESDPAKSHTVAIDNTPVVPPQPPVPPAPPVEQPQPPAPTVEQPQPPTPKPEETANTPTENANPKPVHQKGDGISEPALPELVCQNGTGISEPAKPEMPAETKKGDSVSEPALPELAYQNSKGISEPEKPEIVIERKKGNGVSEPEKPAIAINQQNGSGITEPALPEQPFNQKSSGVTASEKPDVIIAQQKGNSVSEPALPERLVNQKGTGVTEAEKPAVPVVQQKGTGVTADEKPAVTVQQKGASLTEPEKPTLEIGATPNKTDDPAAETQRPSENTVYTQRLNISYALEEIALLSGSANAAVLGSADAVTQTVAARQQQPVIENERNVWAKTTDNRRKDRSRFGYKAHQNAVVIGGDASGSNYRIGFAAAYSQDDADTAFAQQLRSQSWHGLLYGDYAAGKAKIDFLAGGFYGKTDSERRSLADNGKAEAGYNFHGA
ncbi:hypothetical protein [Neisseria sp.]|uniref:hypothetical protein n=1 Tax=Neisseria sp. TaxID=192066 RepID=UPI0035A135A6